MNNAKIIYLFALVTAVITIALFMDNVLPVAMLPATPSLQYAIDLLSIVTGVGGFFVLLYWFRFSPIRRKLESRGEDYVARICIVRIALWLFLMLSNVVLYYQSLGSATNPKYAVIFLAIAFVFCWPAVPNQSSTSK